MPGTRSPAELAKDTPLERVEQVGDRLALGDPERAGRVVLEEPRRVIGDRVLLAGLVGPAAAAEQEQRRGQDRSARRTPPETPGRAPGQRGRARERAPGRGRRRSRLPSPDADVGLESCARPERRRDLDVHGRDVRLQARAGELQRAGVAPLVRRAAARLADEARPRADGRPRPRSCPAAENVAAADEQRRLAADRRPPQRLEQRPVGRLLPPWFSRTSTTTRRTEPRLPSRREPGDERRIGIDVSRYAR